jgi:hypothetical protein
MNLTDIRLIYPSVLAGKDIVASELVGWTLSSSLLLAGFPACLYAIQGVLTYLGYQNTDSVRWIE